MLSGFLGAGKTTLLNRLLAEADGLRIAVLVNDFGSINIDARLVEAEREDLVELSNGCICCSIQEDLLGAVWNLLDRPEPPDRIVVEASGVADPAAIAFTFASASRHGAIRLDAVVTLLDASSVFEERPAEVAALIDRQLASAGIVVVTKVDLATPTERSAARRMAEAAAPAAAVVESAAGVAPWPLLLGAGFGPGEAHPAHDLPGFAAWSGSSARPVSSLRALTLALQALPAGVLRVKGLVFLDDMPERAIVVHRVGTRTEVQPGAPWGGDAPMTQLVAIGLAGAVEPATMDAWFAAHFG
ncbi:MAG: GTP-binding protein [Rhodothermales bacterium]